MKDAKAQMANPSMPGDGSDLKVVKTETVKEEGKLVYAVYLRCSELQFIYQIDVATGKVLDWGALIDPWVRED